jgi:hypothetical protein
VGCKRNTCWSGWWRRRDLNPQAPALQSRSSTSTRASSSALVIATHPRSHWVPPLMPWFRVTKRVTAAPTPRLLHRRGRHSRLFSGCALRPARLRPIPGAGPAHPRSALTSASRRLGPASADRLIMCQIGHRCGKQHRTGLTGQPDRRSTGELDRSRKRFLFRTPCVHAQRFVDPLLVLAV